MVPNITIEQARERVAKRAEADGEHDFAREVRAGCWDHRRDVQAALAGRKLRGEENFPTSHGFFI